MIGIVFTRADRERAAHALSAMASDRACVHLSCTPFLALLGGDPDDPAFVLASAAFSIAPDRVDKRGRYRYELMYAEAEAHVRCGWMPDDDPRNPTGTPL